MKKELFKQMPELKSVIKNRFEIVEKISLEKANSINRKMGK